jgi:hypothetical protein
LSGIFLLVLTGILISMNILLMDYNVFNSIFTILSIDPELLILDNKRKIYVYLLVLAITKLHPQVLKQIAVF